MFNSESGLVKIWVKLIQDGTYTKESIPKISNLQDVVLLILKEEDIRI